MRVLVDTNVVSELRKGIRCHPAVSAWQRTIPLASQFLSVVSLFELWLGIALKERRDAPAAEVLRTWLAKRVMPAFNGRILAVDAAVAERCAPMHVERTRPFRDSLIAATAAVHGLTIATGNLRDFEGLGPPLVDPWSAER